MRVAVLASGSAGNCAFVETAGARLLVDAGLGPHEIGRRLARVPGSPRLSSVDAVLVTHEHGDHASGAAALAALGLPIWGPPSLSRIGVEVARALGPGDRFAIGDATVHAVGVPHDVPALGYRLECDGDGGRAGVLTDCGHPTGEIADAFAGLDVLVLESNHDEQMLRAGPYPPSLKRRIASRLGHLSNGQSAVLLRRMGAGAPRALVLAHLSQVNNRPQIARSVCTAALGRRRCLVELAYQTRVSSVVTVGAGGLSVDRLHAGVQLGLFDQGAAAS